MKHEKANRTMHLQSFELAPPLLTNIGKVSTCHSERRKTKKEERGLTGVGHYRCVGRGGGGGGTNL
jgi:hypothetical protein